MIAYIKQIFSAVWSILDFTRRALANVLLLIIVGVVIGLFFRDPTPSVPDKSVLVIELSGDIVESSRFSGGTLSALAKGSDSQTRLRDVLRALQLAQTDKRISDVLIRLEDLQRAGMASLREIGVAMDRVKAAGKKITVWSTAYSQRQYAVASHASEVFMHPMGQVMIKGLSAKRLYWGDLLRELGVTVHVFKAGAYKSAPEPFVLNAPSNESLAADLFWLTDEWSQFTDAIETSRGLMPGAVQKLIDNLPEHLQRAQGDFSRVALNESLIDGVAAADQVRKTLMDRQGRSEKEGLRSIDYRDYLLANPVEDTADKVVAVITLEGEIKDGIDGPGMTGERDAVTHIRAAIADPKVAALLVRIDSPGGSAVASELIRRELELAKAAHKPVVASLGDYAASGGYWVALAADKIVTDPMSVTGSIGVFGMVPTVEKSLSKLNICAGGVSTSWLADADNPATGIPKAYERVMEMSVARTYSDFISLVSKSRHLDKKSVSEIAQGRVYTGRQALQFGLADKLGGMEDALKTAGELAGLPKDKVPKAVWFESKQSRWEILFDRLVMQAAQATGLDRVIADYAGLLESAPIQEGARLKQLVNSPQSLYAHCLCNAPQ